MWGGSRSNSPPMRKPKGNPVKTYRHVVALSIVASLIVLRLAGAGEKPVPGINELYRLDLLPKLKSFESVGCVSSRDPTGGNDDGFAPKRGLRDVSGVTRI